MKYPTVSDGTDRPLYPVLDVDEMQPFTDAWRRLVEEGISAEEAVRRVWDAGPWRARMAGNPEPAPA